MNAVHFFKQNKMRFCRISQGKPCPPTPISFFSSTSMRITEHPLHDAGFDEIEKFNRIKELSNKPRLTWQQGFA
jgi:hypothetical protein